MPEYSDIYVISSKRDAKTINAFLNEFVPENKQSADDFNIPQFSENPTKTFTNVQQLLTFLDDKPNIEYSIYWSSTNNSKPEHAMLFYLKDGNVIYGLSTDASDSEFANELLNKLKIFLKSELGYIAWEACPNVDDLDGFIQQIDIYSKLEY